MPLLSFFLSFLSFHAAAWLANTLSLSHPRSQCKRAEISPLARLRLPVAQSIKTSTHVHVLHALALPQPIPHVKSEQTNHYHSKE